MSRQKWINVGLAVGMALALVVAVVALMQVGIEYQEMSLTGIGWMLDGDATDLLVVDQTSTGDVAEFRDDGTVVLRILDGGLITTSGALDVGSTITATTWVTSYTNLDASGTLNVDGATTLNSTLDVDGNISSGTGAVTVTDASGLVVSYLVDVGTWLNMTPATAVSVTAGAIITGAGTYQPLTSAAAVTCSTSCCIYTGTRTGDLLVLENQNASDVITIDGTGGNVECKTDRALGAGDILTLLWNGTNWYCIAYNDNS